MLLPFDETANRLVGLRTFKSINDTFRSQIDQLHFYIIQFIGVKPAFILNNKEFFQGFTSQKEVTQIIASFEIKFHPRRL